MFKRTILLAISILCLLSIYPNNIYARRSRLSYAVLDYESLIYKIEIGRELISVEGNILVYGCGAQRNLAHLNDIPRYYSGSEGIYWLALDLELAIKEGYIDFYRDINSFDITQLNKLSDSFKESLGLNKAYFGCEKFLNLRSKVYTNPENYRGNEGLIRLAFEGDVGSLTQLYDAFDYKAEELNWERLNGSLSKLKRAKQLFEKHSLDAALEEYGGLEGLSLLAERASIDDLRIVYYTRNEFEGYDPELFGWEITEDSNSSNSSSIPDSLSSRLDELHLSNTNSYYINTIGLENVRYLLQASEKAVDIIANFAVIDDYIKRVYTVYGSNAQGSSDLDKRLYKDCLNSIDSSVKRILEHINADIIGAAREDSSLASLTLEAQADLLLTLEVLSSFKGQTLIRDDRSITGRHKNNRSYLFYPVAGMDCDQIVLTLHDEETSGHEECIRWKMRKGDSDESSVYFLLERKRRTHEVFLTLGSPAIDRVYVALGKHPHYGFMFNVPELNSEANFKWLVRIFY